MMYLSAYVNLITRHMGLDGTNEEMNALAVEMVDTVNLATQIAWCALMSDPNGVSKGMEELKTTVDKLLEENHVE